MAITVKGGMVSLSTNASVKAEVVEINFPNSNRVAGQVPASVLGILCTKNVPDHQNFAQNDVLNYWDSNNNNNASLTVTSVVGPTKYNVSKN